MTALRMHVLLSSFPLNVPVLAQSLQAASSANAVPASYPLPAPQDVTVLSAHALVSSLLLNMPAAQSMHPALSTLAVPATYPLPAPQDATECGLQAVCPAASEYVPCPQDAHVASALLVRLAGPKAPMTHSVPLHAIISGLAENVPGAQSVQITVVPLVYLNLPATHVAEQICASSAALPRYLPLGHELSVHGELSVFTEYLPEPQGSHVASAVAVPATDPVPVAHGGDVCGTQASLPMLTLYVPSPQTAHTASSAVAVPSTKPFPVPHDEMLCSVQGLLSVVVENHPAAQSVQLNEADVCSCPNGQEHAAPAIHSSSKRVAMNAG